MNTTILDFDEFDHEFFMRVALKEAERAGKRGDRPIGAVIVHNGDIISISSSKFMSMDSNVAHAENTAIFNCASYLKKYGKECTIYTTVEPCIMCLTTIVMSKIRNIVFALEDRYMNMMPFINSNSYIVERLDNYIGSVLERESIQIYRRYAPRDLDIMTKVDN